MVRHGVCADADRQHNRLSRIKVRLIIQQSSIQLILQRYKKNIDCLNVLMLECLSGWRGQITQAIKQSSNITNSVMIRAIFVAKSDMPRFF
jgi:hypothetical protein